MDERDFTRLIQHLRSLYPRARGAFDPPWDKIWARALIGFSNSVVEQAVAEHATDSPFTPKPADIAKRANRIHKARKDAERPQKPPDPEPGPSIDQRRQELHGRLSEKDMLRHRASVLSSDPKMAFLSRRSVDSPSWVSIISRRLRDGLGPDDPEPDAGTGSAQPPSTEDLI